MSHRATSTPGQLARLLLRGGLHKHKVTTDSYSDSDSDSDSNSDSDSDSDFVSDPAFNSYSEGTKRTIRELQEHEKIFAKLHRHSSRTNDRMAISEHIQSPNGTSVDRTEIRTHGKQKKDKSDKKSYVNPKLKNQANVPEFTCMDEFIRNRKAVDNLSKKQILKLETWESSVAALRLYETKKYGFASDISKLILVALSVCKLPCIDKYTQGLQKLCHKIINRINAEKEKTSDELANKIEAEVLEKLQKREEEKYHHRPRHVRFNGEAEIDDIANGLNGTRIDAESQSSQMYAGDSSGGVRREFTASYQQSSASNAGVPRRSGSELFAKFDSEIDNNPELMAIRASLP
jgi:hypothetical protein